MEGTNIIKIPKFLEIDNVVRSWFSDRIPAQRLFTDLLLILVVGGIWVLSVCLLLKSVIRAMM